MTQLELFNVVFVCRYVLILYFFCQLNFEWVPCESCVHLLHRRTANEHDLWDENVTPFTSNLTTFDMFDLDMSCDSHRQSTSWRNLGFHSCWSILLLYSISTSQWVTQPISWNLTARLDRCSVFWAEPKFVVRPDRRRCSSPGDWWTQRELRPCPGGGSVGGDWWAKLNNWVVPQKQPDFPGEEKPWKKRIFHCISCFSHLDWSLDSSRLR